MNRLRWWRKPATASPDLAEVINLQWARMERIQAELDRLTADAEVLDRWAADRSPSTTDLLGPAS